MLGLAIAVCPPAIDDVGFPGQRVGIDAGAPLRLAGDAPLTQSTLDAGLEARATWQAGTYVSPVLVTPDGWERIDGLSWELERPSGLPLPDARAVEAFSADSIDMTGNVLLFHFEEPAWGPGLAVVDSSGNDFDAVIDAGAMPVQGGIVGQAARFFGDTCLTVPDRPALRPTTALTISVWFFARLLDGNPHGLVASRFDFMDRSAFTFYLWSNDHLWADLDTENDRIEGSLTVTPNEWHHAVLIFDGSRPSATRVQIWLDDQLDGEYPESSASLAQFGPDVNIGCLINPSTSLNQGFDGDLDEVALWHRALSASEVHALYRRGASRVRFDVRGCAEATCAADPPWVRVAEGTPPPALMPFVQYRAFLQGEGGPWPEVSRVSFLGTCRADAGTPEDGGAASDAGSSDAGSSDAGAADAGTGLEVDGGQPGRRLSVGSGCSATDLGSAAWLLVLLVRRRTCSGWRAESR